MIEINNDEFQKSNYKSHLRECYNCKFPNVEACRDPQRAMDDDFRDFVEFMESIQENI